MSNSDYREISNALNNYYGNKMKLYVVGSKYREEYRQKMKEQKKLVEELSTKAEAFDEYKAKVKAFDEIREARKEVLSDVRERGLKLPADLDKFSMMTERIINKYESGELE